MFQTFDPVSDRSFAGRHLPILRKRLAAHQVDALLVPHDDEYQNEYIPAYAERLMWVSGFSGSAGFAIVGLNRAVIFTDGRYTLQVRDQTDSDLYEFEDITATTPMEWIEKQGGAGARYGYDPMLHSRNAIDRFQKAAQRAGSELVPLSSNPIDEAWTDQPARPNGDVRAHAEQYAGKSAAKKIASIAKVAADEEVDAIFIAAPPSVAWLFNIRGGDVTRTPLALARALVKADGSATLFAGKDRVAADVAAHFGEGVDIDDEARIADHLRALGAEGAAIGIDFDQAPALFVDIIEEAGGRPIHVTDPCVLPRARKNDVELAGSRTAHVRDGIAITRFLHWLDVAAQDGSVDEITAAQKLESFRTASNELVDLSFDSISASGPNGAHCHYRVSTETNRKLNPGELYLIDSGGQYPDGTTDITRTAPIGQPTEEMRDRFTRVLKGHIAIATARFPRGVSGGQIDAFARRPLWEVGLDYDHGTGHGVGSFLGVHEGPQRIAKAGSDQELLPGMILSNEPGFYKTGEYGIRIENLIIVTPPAPVEGGDREMMGFETITLAPIDRRLIDVALLTDKERAWLNAYHARVASEIGPRLGEETRKWLALATAPI